MTDSRYFRVEYLVDVAPSSINSAAGRLNIQEICDFNRTFGQAALSFEILEESTQTWIKYISASDIGTISNGQAITKQIGSTIVDDPITGKFNKSIPSTQTNFRTKLVVTDNLRTAVSIIADG